jgi:uncharacterized membrane protein
VFKNRTYLFGLGVGLIVGAILLQLMIVAKNASATYSNPSTNTDIAEEKLSSQKLKEEASKEFQVFDKTEKVYTQKEFDAELQKKIKEEKDKLAAQPAGSPSETKRTILYIQPNLTVSAITESLFKAGIVSDRRALEEEITKQQATGKMQAGYHVFEGTLTNEQIVKLLITEQ